MSAPQGAGGAISSSSRGLFLTLVAVALGVVVLASVARVRPTTSGATTLVAPPATTVTTSAPATTTTTLGTHSPASVKVLVANGTTTKGIAGKLATKLNGAGYNTLSPTDTNVPAHASAVYYLTGYQGDAQAVAAAAGLGAGVTQAMSSAVPVAVGSADVVVVIGPDLASSL